MRKNTLFIIVLLLSFRLLFAQVGINATGSAPDPSAGLDVNFTDLGFLPPRLTGSQISAIPGPAKGLLVFNVTENAPAYFDGTLWRTFDGKKAWLACGDPIKKIHLAGSVAPVNKTVIYGTVTNIPGEPAKCWITSNLGADRQADSVDDPTEPSAGWYWQFGKKRGFKNDGTTRTPDTAWITAINTSSDWTVETDPCTIELGSPWRIPTRSEWTNVDANVVNPWGNWNGPWISGLKMHAAGLLWANNGTITTTRGVYGRYWSSTQSTATKAWALLFSSINSYLNADTKTYAYSIRCVRQ
jgi:hypothetical protein